jgi:hypothetical protein
MEDEPGSGAADVGPRSRRDLDRVAAWLARRDVASLTRRDLDPVDVLVLCGSAVLGAVDVAAAAYRDGLVSRVLVSGGVGHSTPYLHAALRAHPRYGDVPTADRSEAAVIAEILRRHHGVPDGALLVEERSTNCGENASCSVAVLRREPGQVRSLLLVQDPTMQRRTHESFHRSLRGTSDVRLLSFAPFVPTVPDPGAACVTDDTGTEVWSMDRFRSLLLGEVRRLQDDEHGYGPRGSGFLDHVEIPVDVMAAYRRLAATSPGAAREVWRP